MIDNQKQKKTNRLSWLITRTLFFLGFISSSCYLFAQEVTNINSAKERITLGKHSYIYIDSAGQCDIKKIQAIKSFYKSQNDVPIFQVNEGNIWIRFTLSNKSESSSLLLNLPYSNISFLEFYKIENGKVVKRSQSGNALKYSKRNKTSTNNVFNLELNKGDTATYFLKANSNHPLLLPMFIETAANMEYSESMQTIITGIYIGIILAIILYNFFLYLSTKDKDYFIYILYLFFLGLAQVTLKGYAFQFLWPQLPVVNNYAVIASSALAGMTGIIFGIYFLRAKHYLPGIIPYLSILVIAYFVAIVASLSGYNSISYYILNYTSLIGGLTLLVSAWIIGQKGYKAAYFYFVAWCSFLIGMVIFVLRNLDLLPYNFFTTYILYVGSAIEAILLSIALADKINILRREKEASQAEALKISKQNEKLVREQNIILERNVDERTKELQLANGELTFAYKNLEDAQIQLVEAEKMASLGQLTAGIAHEINNPINFVKSNIKPLQLDIKDMIKIIDEYEKLHVSNKEDIEEQLKRIDKLKQDIDLDFVKIEIGNLMTGIEDGAERTAEIVRGLRTFSRLDESQIKTVNIHEGIESTLVLLRSHIPVNIQVIKGFKANGTIECFPGKLNQVFMNMINNAIQAIKEKETMTHEEFITISTEDISENEIEIRIKDSGIGMTEEIKKKIFDPFFTTKEVGEGTGLGLAIVFKIIKEHGGRINVISSKGQGAEFVITLFHSIPSAAF
jgi:hypothetical protein